MAESPNKGSQSGTTKPAGAAANANPAAPGQAKKDGGEKKPAAPRTVAGHPLNAKITLGKNKEGKAYGPDNNPKRQGSSAASRFALYKDGMTIDEALKAGVRSDDVGFDSAATRGFITITDPPPAPKA